MAGLTKLQAVTLIQQFADDPNAKLWSSANVGLVLGLTADELWGDILDISPHFASQLDEDRTATTPGYVNLATALTKRRYRIQKVVRNGVLYVPRPAMEATVSANLRLSGDYQTYSLFGDQMWLFPLSTSADTDIRYSWIPPRIDGLADGDTVVWPDGYEMAYIFSTVARLVQKGGRESGDWAQKEADKVLYRMKAKIQRNEIGPMGMTFYDSPEDWGVLDDGGIY